MKHPSLTLFNQIHYMSYSKLVIKNPHINELIKEATKYKDSDEGSENLKGLLDKIEEISTETSKNKPPQTN